MDYQWNTTFQKIGLVWEPGIVRVKSDRLLMEYLAAGKRAAAKKLSKHAIAEYRRIYGKELKISERSLACEIYWHYYMWKKALFYEERHGKKRATSWVLYHMDVIDCGERAVDNNRFLWDLLSVFF